ncbi:MAG: hypothetical protein RLZZ319_121, partial [Actinomycetota bacterium]
MRIEFEFDHEGKPVGRLVSFDGPVARPSDEPLVGSRVRLERLSSAKHSHDLYEAFSVETDDSLWTYMFQGPFRDHADFTSWVSSVEQTTDPLFYAIIDLATGKAVGVASYLRIDPINRTIEVGWIT